MAIIQDGTEYQDGVHYEFATNPLIPKDLKKFYSDQMEMNTNKQSGDFQSRFLAANVPDKTGIDPEQLKTFAGKGAEGPEKPAGAFIQSVGYPGSGEGFLGRLSMAGAFKDWYDRQKTYPERIVNTVKGMTNPSYDEDIKLVKGLWDSAKDAFYKFPQEAMTGQIDLNSPDAIERSFNLASFMVFGPAPLAKKTVDGTLGSFAGVKSRGFDLPKMLDARKMEAAGKDPDIIHAATGMFRGADGKWRYEIPDNSAVINEDALKYVPTSAERSKTAGKFEQIPFDPNEGASVAKLSDFYDHPELYKAYPQLKKINIIEDLNYKGVAEAGEDYIKYNPTNLAREGYTLKQIMVHEVQHLIQNIEGFAKGGSPAMALEHGEGSVYKLKYKLDADVLQKISEAQKSLANKFFEGKKLSVDELDNLSYFSRLIDTHAKYLSEADKQAITNYRKLAGEVESRNIEARLHFDEDVLKTLHPRYTQEIPNADQIVIKDAAWATPYGIKDPKTGEILANKKVNSAALEYDGKIYEGKTHGHAFEKMMKENPNFDFKKVKDGFTTSDGSFVSREKALEIARNEGQVREGANYTRHGLMSEDVKPAIASEKDMRQFANDNKEYVQSIDPYTKEMSKSPEEYNKYINEVFSGVRSEKHDATRKNFEDMYMQSQSDFFRNNRQQKIFDLYQENLDIRELASKERRNLTEFEKARLNRNTDLAEKMNNTKWFNDPEWDKFKKDIPPLFRSGPK